MVEPVRYPGMVLAAVAVGALVGPVAAASPAYAVPPCPASASAGGAQVTAVPWAQERYAPQRISPLADGSGVTVAVIDSGVDAHHPQLAGAVRPGTDLLDSGDGTVDCVSHGTAVASIIAARPAAAISFRGLAPAAEILPVRVSEQQVLEAGPSGRTVPAAGLAQAIRYAVGHGAAVINLSVVLYRDDRAVRAAVRYAVDRDVVVVAAVGNQHPEGDRVPYPAAYDGVLGVGAIGPDGARVPSSPAGSYVDIVAPGAQVTAATRVRGHGTYEGTSFATPFVSATAALVRQYWPGLPAAAVIRRILATADPTPGGRGNEYGYGALNPYRAVTEQVATGAPETASPLRAAGAHTGAGRDGQARDEQLAIRLAGMGGGAATLVLLGAVVLPRATRRRHDHR
jgi:type VII secretion-associated serine protease mycosin